MNRLATQANHPWQQLIPATPASGIGSALAERPIRPAVDTPLATFLPLNYEPGYAYPLVVWLHDSEGSERHLPQVMQHLSTQNFVAVAPRGTHECRQAVRGFRWVQQPVAIAEADRAVTEAVDFAKQQFHIHSDRVFLVGHGTGGSMALRLAAQRPERFAGAASLNGELPRRHALLRNMDDFRKVPLFVATTRDSTTYPEQHVCSDLRLLHSAGCNVALRQYPGDDELTTVMLADINRWMMQRVCGD